MGQEQITEKKITEEIKAKEKEMVEEAKTKTEKIEGRMGKSSPLTSHSSSNDKKTDGEKEETKEKKPEKKKETPKEKKTSALVNGSSLHISTKHAIAICNFIKGKNIESAISELEKAEKMKIPIPMRGEIPHKKGIMSGRYPIKAIGEFIKLLKSLKANAIANELELEKVFISCKANVASRPYRRFGRKRFKRTHVEIKLTKKVKKKTKKQTKTK